MEYFSNGPIGLRVNAQCSDNACLCTSTPFKTGEGYLYVSEEAVKLRKKARRMTEAQDMINGLRGGVDATVHFDPVLWSGIMVCKRAAIARGLNLTVAADDAKQWWTTGKMPLRPTPMAENKITTGCPECKQGVRVPSDRGILKITCPKCGISWQWSPPTKISNDNYSDTTVKEGDEMSAFFMGKEGQPSLSELQQYAKQGSALAQYLLGMLYQDGLGISQDYELAGEWFRKAAEQGQDDAQFFLGSLYVQGLGVPRDYVEAYAWVNTAAEQGHTQAIVLGKKLKEALDPDSLTKAQTLSKTYALR